MIKDVTLCLITNTQYPFSHAYLDFILQAVKGGVTSVQLRDKSASPSEIHCTALALKSCLAPFNVPLIINDHLDIARAVDADGVHLGQSDHSPIDARKLLGPNKIIGLSIETQQEFEIANSLTCLDYIAASAVFPSATKTNCKTIWGLDGLKMLTAQSKYPVIAIGGITLSNTKTTIEAGAAGIAVISAIHDAPDPAIAAAQFIRTIKEANHV